MDLNSAVGLTCALKAANSIEEVAEALRKSANHYPYKTDLIVVEKEVKRKGLFGSLKKPKVELRQISDRVESIKSSISNLNRRGEESLGSRRSLRDPDRYKKDKSKEDMER